MTSDGGSVEEFGQPLGGRFRGVSRGPRASLDAALQQAAMAAAAAGYAGRQFDVTIEIEPQDHNQWIRGFSVIIEEM